MYFASNDTVLVNFAQKKALIFDSNGYLVEEKNSILQKPQNVISESNLNKMDGKYFILADQHQKISLLRCNNGRFRKSSE